MGSHTHIEINLIYIYDRCRRCCCYRSMLLLTKYFSHVSMRRANNTKIMSFDWAFFCRAPMFVTKMSINNCRLIHSFFCNSTFTLTGPVSQTFENTHSITHPSSSATSIYYSTQNVKMCASVQAYPQHHFTKHFMEIIFAHFQNFQNGFSLTRLATIGSAEKKVTTAFVNFVISVENWSTLNEPGAALHVFLWRQISGILHFIFIFQMVTMKCEEKEEEGECHIRKLILSRKYLNGLMLNNLINAK